MDNQQRNVQNESGNTGRREPSRAELQKERNIQNNAKNIRNAADVAIASKNPYGVAIGGAIKTADKMTGGKASEKMGKAMNTMSKMSIRGRQLQALSNKLSESGASDAIGAAASAKNAADGNKSSAVGASNNKGKPGDKSSSNGKSLKQKDAEDQQKSYDSGNFNISFKRSTLVKLGLFCSILSCVMMLFIIMIATIADNEGASIVMGDMVSEDKDLVNDIIDEVGDETGEDLGHGSSDDVVDVGMGDYDLGMGNSSYDEYYERFAILGNAFSSENLKCKGEECLERPEYRYYLKIADIALRYKNKYKINLDWILLSATVQYNDMTQEAIMDAHVHDYDLDAVEDYDELMDLDWDYDYKTIPDYTYLDPDDYRYDLQILAKNMVAKTTTQTCTKRVEDEDGNITVVVTKSRQDQDIEDQYLEPGQPYYLQCDAGETYSINSVYKLSPEKYDEFLLEYLEHKFYLDRGLGHISGDGEYIFPLANGATSCRTSAYGYRYHPINGQYHYHSGDDYPAAGGTPVYAVADGVVSAAGYDSSMGNYIYIDHADGLRSIYMHASKLHVKTGDRVSKGDEIMAVGTTGSSTGNHLHITFKKNGQLVDPANYIGALPMC